MVEKRDSQHRWFLGFGIILKEQSFSYMILNFENIKRVMNRGFAIFLDKYVLVWFYIVGLIACVCYFLITFNYLAYFEPQ